MKNKIKNNKFNIYIIYYYADCYIMQTKYIENYYNKGDPAIGD